MVSKRKARSPRDSATPGSIKVADFESLVGAIVHVHAALRSRAVQAVNVSLTLRNWMIGCRIVEYELHGQDRSRYGEKFVDLLAEKLTRQGVSNCDRRQLYRYRDFYVAFPKIVGTVSPQLRTLLPGKMPVPEKVGAASPQLGLPPMESINRLSYSHFEELVEMDDPLKRAFYEEEIQRFIEEQIQGERERAREASDLGQAHPS